MKTLIVGAGALGQVFGCHLQRGGADVTFLVKPSHLGWATKPLTLYPSRRRRPFSRSLVLSEHRVVTSAREAVNQRWDAVLLCVSSTALRTGDWLDTLSAGLGEATLLAIQPGLDDRDYLARCAPEAQTVWGMAKLVAYWAPLRGEVVHPSGVAYWTPPGGGLWLSGDSDRAGRLASTLLDGGLPARVRPDIRASMAVGGAVLDVQMAALECAGWRFGALRRDRKLLALNAHAATQAATAAARLVGKRPPAGLRLLRPLSLSAGLRLAPLLTPFDLERYFEAHFTKVGEQTRRSLSKLGEMAAASGQTHDGLTALIGRLDAARRASARPAPTHETTIRATP